jgi:hypothetical protein
VTRSGALGELDNQFTLVGNVPPFCSAGIGVVSAAGLERSSSRKHEDSLTAARHF